MTEVQTREQIDRWIEHAVAPLRERIEALARVVTSSIHSPDGTGDDAGDAATLRGFIKTYGMTPSMMASDRDKWHRVAMEAGVVTCLVERAGLAQPSAGIEHDLDAGTVARNLRRLEARMQYRVEAIEQRDGKGKGAIEGQGIGIGYLLAKDIVGALGEAATFVETHDLAQGPTEPLQCLRCGTVDAFGPVSKERVRASWQCVARKQGTPGGNAPADCDWPGCGCDPAASKVLEAIDEAGFDITPRPLIQKIEAEARRYAEMYPQSSDGRNTFVIFADWVAALALSSTNCGGGK